MPYIDVTYDTKTGKVTFDVNGFKGESCLKKTEWLEKAFPKGKIEKKKEFYEKEKTVKLTETA